MHTMKIQDMPQFTKLVKDYTSNFDKSILKSFFEIPPNVDAPALQPLLEAREKIAQNDPHIRKTIVQEMERQGNGETAQKKNLELLKAPTTMAVVTGQQVSLFGGPLYTIYKTVSAIELSLQLKEAYPKYNFVPIFWLETEDHDIEEMRSITVLNNNFEPRTISYRSKEETDAKQWRKQVGPTQIEGEAIARCFEELATSLTKTEFTDEVLAFLKHCYREGTTFSQAFRGFLDRMFAKEGLLILDANTPELKKAGAALFRREIETTPKLSEGIVLDTGKLEEHYAAQIKPKALNLFIVENGERLPLIEKEESIGAHTKTSSDRSFFLKGTRKTFSLAELNDLIGKSPQSVSPNVVMRPLYQDTLLPTVAYVAGPGEIAYFAQLRSAYRWAGIPMPLIYPRISATILEEKFERLFEKQSINFEAVISTGRQFIETFLAGLSDEKLEQSFEQSRQEMDRTMESLRSSVKSADGSLDDAYTALKGKILTLFKDFSNKVAAGQRKKNSTLRLQLEQALNEVLPENALQERKLSFIYFLNKYGFQFWNGIREALRRPNPEDHLLLKVSDLKQTMNPNGNVEESRTSNEVRSLVAVPNE